MIVWLAATAQAAWVLQADTDRRLARALRILDRADATVDIWLDPFTVCVEVEATPRLARRLTRKLGQAPEERLDCDVAWFALGRGYVAVLLEQPAESLETALADAHLPYVDVRMPSDVEQPVRLCVPRGALPDPMGLAHVLTDAGLSVRSVYEVGACTR